MKQYKRGDVFTLEEVFSLNLPDSPILSIQQGLKRIPIQDSHVTVEDLLSDENIRNTLWEYQRTTHEQIPIFYAAVESQVLPLVHISMINDDEWDENVIWITWKKFPRDYWK